MTISTHMAPLAAREQDMRNRALVRGWLNIVLVVLVALIMVGGATRMTGLGFLSRSGSRSMGSFHR